MPKKLITVARDYTLVDNLTKANADKLLTALVNSKANEFCEFFLVGEALGYTWKVCSRNRAEVKAFLKDPDSYMLEVL